MKVIRFWRQYGVYIVLAIAMMCAAMAFVIGAKCTDYVFGSFVLALMGGLALGAFVFWGILEMYRNMTFRMWFKE